MCRAYLLFRILFKVRTQAVDLLRLVPDLLVEGLELLLDPLVPLPLAVDDNLEHINFIKYKEKKNNKGHQL